MALAPVVQGSVGAYQDITWTREDGTAQNLTGATLTGRIRSQTAPYEPSDAISGVLSLVTPASGIFRWTYAAGDVDTAGMFDVQFTASYSAGAVLDKSMIETWEVEPAIGTTQGLIMSADAYDMVRSLIDLSLTEDNLPDDVIAQPIYHGAAENYIAEKDPLYATRTGAERLHLFNAAVLLTAAYIFPAVPFLVREDFGDYSATMWREKGFIASRIAELRSRANSEINAVIVPGTLFGYPQMFTVGKGGRGV